jgi:hypothetical protein
VYLGHNRDEMSGGGGPSWAKIAVVLGVATLLCGITVFYGNLGGGGRGGGDFPPALSPRLGEQMNVLHSRDLHPNHGVGQRVGRQRGDTRGRRCSLPHPARSAPLLVPSRGGAPGGGGIPDGAVAFVLRPSRLPTQECQEYQEKGRKGKGEGYTMDREIREKRRERRDAMDREIREKRRERRDGMMYTSLSLSLSIYLSISISIYLHPFHQLPLD